MSESRKKWAPIVADFRKHKIHAFMPGEREFELSVATGNLLYRFTQPDCVVQPENAHEIGYVIKRAQKADVNAKVTVKCGGHSYTGFSTANNGILMDLKRMKDVELQFDQNGQPENAVVSAGARWGDVYRTLIHDAYRGYIINGGRCPSVGVSGFLLGGGLGPFTREVGMGSDTVSAMKIVTADGEEKEVDRQQNPDLFWALRGGGCGNFGVVTEFKLDAKKLKGDNVVAGRYTWMPLAGNDDLEKAKKTLSETMNAFYNTDWPKNMTIDSNWMMDVKNGKAELSIRFIIYFDGSKQEFEQVINDHFVDDESQNPDKNKIVNKSLKEQIIRRSLQEPSTRFLYETLVLLWEEEARFALPRPGDNAYQKFASFCFELKPEIVSEVIKIVRAEQGEFEGRLEFKKDNASLWVTFIHSGGAATEYSSSETAFPWRNCTFQTYVTLKWTDKWLEHEVTEVLLAIKNKLGKYSMTYEGGEPATFMNFSDATLEKGKHEKAYYGANHERLRKVKAEYDPNDFFENPWDRILEKPLVEKARRKAPALMSVASKSADRSRQTQADDGSISSGDDEKTVVDDVDLFERMADDLTDSIAKNDWDSFKLPPGDMPDIYGRLYVDDF